MQVYKLGGQILPPEQVDAQEIVYFSYEIAADNDEAALIRAQTILNSESRLRHGWEVAATMWRGERIVQNLGVRYENVIGLKAATAIG